MGNLAALTEFDIAIIGLLGMSGASDRLSINSRMNCYVPGSDRRVKAITRESARRVNLSQGNA